MNAWLLLLVFNYPDDNHRYTKTVEIPNIPNYNICADISVKLIGKHLLDGYKVSSATCINTITGEMK